MGRIANTIELAKSSWRVLKADKELLALPIISGIATLIVAASFVIPLIGVTEEPGPLTYIIAFVGYMILAYITIFFNAAIVHAADERMSGGDPTLGSALRGAASRAGAILPWAVVSATVSIIIQAIEERAGALGRIVGTIAGMAWSVVTFLVLPILVLEGIGVGDAIRRSGEMFKRTWGENIGAQVGFGLLGFLAILPAVAVAAAGIAAGGGVAVAAIVVAVAWGVLVAVVISTLSVVFQTALYHYAAGTPLPEAFTAEHLQSSFVPRRGRGGLGGGFAGR